MAIVQPYNVSENPTPGLRVKRTRGISNLWLEIASGFEWCYLAEFIVLGSGTIGVNSCPENLSSSTQCLSVSCHGSTIFPNAEQNMHACMLRGWTCSSHCILCSIWSNSNKGRKSFRNITNPIKGQMKFANSQEGNRTQNLSEKWWLMPQLKVPYK